MSDRDDMVLAEAKRLREKFGGMAPQVVDEILDKAESGYDYDASFEVPFYTKVKEKLAEI